MIDLHLHTKFSFDSDELPEKYVEQAKRLGVKVIGFSDHYDYDAYLEGEGEQHLANIPKIFKTVKELNAEGNVEVLCGIEFGYSKDAQEKYKQLADYYPFDYIINSVHTLPERGDCYYDNFFKGKSLKESYSDYFDAVLESLKSSFDYQIVGHIGYASRYRSGEGSKIVYTDFSDVIDSILKEIIIRDKCLEINTSIGKSTGKFLPDTDIIERYVELGGRKLSFGSDAHGIEKYLNGSKLVAEFLKSIGIDELYYYKKRKPICYKI